MISIWSSIVHFQTGSILSCLRNSIFFSTTAVFFLVIIHAFNSPIKKNSQMKSFPLKMSACLFISRINLSFVWKLSIKNSAKMQVCVMCKQPLVLFLVNKSYSVTQLGKTVLYNSVLHISWLLEIIISSTKIMQAGKTVLFCVCLVHPTLLFP